MPEGAVVTEETLMLTETEEQIEKLKQMVDEKQHSIDKLRSVCDNVTQERDEANARAAMMQAALAETQGHINTLCRAIGRLMS